MKHIKTFRMSFQSQLLETSAQSPHAASEEQPGAIYTFILRQSERTAIVAMVVKACRKDWVSAQPAVTRTTADTNSYTDSITKPSDPNHPEPLCP